MLHGDSSYMRVAPSFNGLQAYFRSIIFGRWRDTEEKARVGKVHREDGQGDHGTIKNILSSFEIKTIFE